MHAYPDNAQIRRAKNTLLLNQAFWDDSKPPSEYRFGCKYNPHMKLRVREDKLQADTNAFQDGPEIQECCQEIKYKIETQWKSEGLPVYHGRE